MYKRTSKGWMKHLDFIILDVLSLVISLFLALWMYSLITSDSFDAGVLLITSRMSLSSYFCSCP